MLTRYVVMQERWYLKGVSCRRVTGPNGTQSTEGNGCRAVGVDVCDGLHGHCQSSESGLDVTLEFVNLSLSVEFPWETILLEGVEKPGAGVRPITECDTWHRFARVCALRVGRCYRSGPAASGEGHTRRHENSRTCSGVGTCGGIGDAKPVYTGNAFNTVDRAPLGPVLTGSTQSSTHLPSSTSIHSYRRPHPSKVIGCLHDQVRLYHTSSCFRKRHTSTPNARPLPNASLHTYDPTS